MPLFTYRPAEISDIPGIQIVRNGVKENMLSDPSRIRDEDCIPFLTTRGKGWVCTRQDQVVGFAIADLEKENIWALFILPEYEGQGIGKTLQRLMLDWYFSTGATYVWLGTSPGTRAEKFYTASGWIANGFHGDEIKFEMTSEQWHSLNHAQ